MAIKATLIIWYRDLLHYWREKNRMIGTLLMPLIWLVLFGSGISSSLQFSGGAALADFSYIKFLFPGVLGVNVLFTAMFSSISIVTDREFGFLKEIFVAPIPRYAIALGKILGGATVATVQGMLMIILLPLVGLPLSFDLLLLIPFVFLFALVITSMGVALAVRMKSTEGFQMVMQFLTFPMFMLSGALFPFRNAPVWLEILAKFNPATYAIDMLRKVAFHVFEVPTILSSQFSMTLWGMRITLWSNVQILIVLLVVLVGVATHLFSKQDN